MSEAMAEQKTTPAGLKEIARSEHKRLSRTNEPTPPRILECPPELGPAARQEWDRIVGELMSKGVLSSADRGPLAAYCTAYALAMKALEMVHKHGAMIKSPNGYPVQSPYLSHLNKQTEIMIRIASEFGFTPASRSRIFRFTRRIRFCWMLTLTAAGPSGERSRQCIHRYRNGMSGIELLGDSSLKPGWVAF
jgi:P27 family predicted phage terminase small subunit